ncbi:MAG: hypothetical protein LBD52_02810 [Prevotellaceae bacterium]|jgi:hypothetical protein|nr:hypothetical protein [Prevotellaceae bacterium]
MARQKTLKYEIDNWRQRARCTAFLLGALFSTCTVVAQDIEAIAKAPVLTLNGGLSLSQIATFMPGDTTAQDPYAMYLAGNLNLSFFDVVHIPLSFAYTNRQLSKEVSLPFNRFSIAPSYKWVKVYAGYASMQFSPYSLAGHEVFGGGVELTPGNGFKISAICGRLKKAVSGGEGLDSSYQRMGGGFKVEYAGKQFDVGVNIFKAQDLSSSLPDSVAIAPQDNLSGTVSAAINFIKNIRFGAEYGFSALNQNTGKGRHGFRLLETGGNVAMYHAIKTNLTYTSPVGAIGATYERIDPNYITLGAYYMTNDYENITANYSTAIKTVNIAIDGGYQRDNLNGQKTNTTSRMIFSGNVSANIGKELTLSANLSNVQSYVYINDIYDRVTQTNEFQNLDTLNVTQLNYTASLDAAYLLQSGKERRQGFNVGFMYQKSAEQQDFTGYSGNDIYNGSLSYQYAVIPAKFNASASVNYNHNRMPDDLYIRAMTYNGSLQKVFFETLRTAFTCTYSNMANNSGNLSNVFNVRLTGGYVFFKNHNLSLNVAMIHSAGQSKTRVQYSANLAYSYVFNAVVTRKDKGMKLDTNF